MTDGLGPTQRRLLAALFDIDRINETRLWEEEPVRPTSSDLAARIGRRTDCVRDSLLRLQKRALCHPVGWPPDTFPPTPRGWRLDPRARDHVAALPWVENTLKMTWLLAPQQVDRYRDMVAAGVESSEATGRLVLEWEAGRAALGLAA